MFPEYKRKLKVAGITTIVLLSIAVAIGRHDRADHIPQDSGGISVFLLLSGLSFIFMLWYLIRGKARSGWWILAHILLNLIGLIVVLIINDESGES